MDPVEQYIQSGESPIDMHLIMWDILIWLEGKDL